MEPQGVFDQQSDIRRSYDRIDMSSQNFDVFALTKKIQ